MEDIINRGINDNKVKPLMSQLEMVATSNKEISGRMKIFQEMLPTLRDVDVCALSETIN